MYPQPNPHFYHLTVNLKLFIDSMLDVGPGKITQFLCKDCNPHGGQKGRQRGDADSVQQREDLKYKYLREKDGHDGDSRQDWGYRIRRSGTVEQED
jgi:hypothetical protein